MRKANVTVIEFHHRDVKIRRTVIGESTSARLGGKRGKVNDYSQKNYRSLKSKVENTYCNHSYLLTYPDLLLPECGDAFKEDCQRLARHLRKLEGYGIGIKEFGSRSRRPHVHLLMSERIPQSLVRDCWADAIGWSGHLGIRRPWVAARFDTTERFKGYLCKRGKQKTLPGGFGAIGHWSFDINSSRFPKPLVIVGTAKDMAPAVRCIYSHVRAKQRRMGRRELRYNGQRGGTVYRNSEEHYENLNRLALSTDWTHTDLSEDYESDRRKRRKRTRTAA